MAGYFDGPPDDVLIAAATTAKKKDYETEFAEPFAVVGGQE